MLKGIVRCWFGLHLHAYSSETRKRVCFRCGRVERLVGEVPFTQWVDEKQIGRLQRLGFFTEKEKD